MTTRRELVAGLCAVAACAGPEPIGRDSGIDPADLEVALPFADYPALREVDGTASVRTVRGTVLVVRTAVDAAAALSATCTHLGCVVSWRARTETMYCPCHGSEFGPDGQVEVGPATLPLDRYEATIGDDGITVRLT
ncbi:MAG: Rieske 2Fe-2S domain-containing protein [Myxococcota bacterium]